MPNFGFQEVHISWNHNLPVSSQEFCLAYNNILKNFVTYVILDLSKDKILWIKEAVAETCSVKKVFLEISQNSQKTPVPESLF